jgi:hypothetical protein
MAALALGLIGEAPVLVPLIIDAIHLVEGLFKGKEQTGTQKKAAALNIIQDGLSGYATVAPLFGQSASDATKIATDISAAIDAIVTLYNDFKIFSHDTPPIAQ